MRVAASLIAIAAATQAAGQAKLRALVDGRSIGEAAISQKLLSDGSKLVTLSMELSGANGKTVRIRTESLYDSKGAPLRMFLEAITENPRKRRLVTATFDSEGARVVEEVDGRRNVKSVPLVKAAPRENPSEFWFVRDTPKAGRSVKYYRFDLDSLGWLLSTASYAGPKLVTVGGKQVQGHLIAQDRAEAIVDAAGLPLRLVVSGVTFERLN